MSRHVKSRSGCRVCKAKRLKCDETTPACRNCVNRGIACPGYRQVLRWSTKYEHPVAGEKRAGSASASSSAATTAAAAAAAAAIPEFSELATAASQSIKPGSTPSSTPRAPSSESTISFDAFDPFEPVVKTEAAPAAARRPLSQVPPAPSAPVSSLSPASSSTSSSLTSSYGGQHGPPVVPVIAKAVPPSAPDPYSFSYSMPPTSSSSSAATAAAPPHSSLIASANHWQLAPLGDASSVLSFMNEQPVELLDSVDSVDTDNHAHAHDKEDGAFTLELWQPERFARHRYRQQQQQQQQQLLPTPGRGLTLPGTSLVELWFTSVCGMWAAYDSPANPFRRLCSRLWSSNEAVFFSLQTMAAASLPRRPPSVSEIVMLAPQMSTQALIHELQELFGPDGASAAAAAAAAGDGGGPISCRSASDGGPSSMPAGTSSAGKAAAAAFPAGLLTSLFCMSSSLSWIDARQLGIQYLRNARSVIDLLDLRAAQLSADDRELLEFFRGCLLYEEMLRSIVTDDQEDIQALLAWSPPTSADTGDHLHLHAWAGVPIVLIGLFGKVMALCRRSRKVWRKTARATYQLLYQAMQDIQEGQALEAMLLSIEIPIPDGAKNKSSSSSSSDAKLKRHIYKAAEAFRLSSLLQLYQTFPDLVSQHQAQTTQTQPPGQTVLECLPPTGESAAPATGRWLLPLVLHIVDLLSGIPADSPMRCLQPLLCLCAGSALRVETDDGGGGVAVGPAPVTSAVDLVGRGQPPSTDDVDFALSSSAGAASFDFSLSAAGAVSVSTVSTSASTASTSAVHRARDTLRVRLGKLEQNLPPRPITVARQLLETVWLTYDTETPPSRSHWLDIMAETNFESVFG